MKNKLILAVLTALYIMGGCSARKTHLDLTDSTNKSQQAIKVQTQLNEKDKSKVQEIITTSKTDSSETTTTIIPADENITVASDGTFKGKAKSVVTKTKKAGTSKKQKSTDVFVDTEKSKTTDSTANKKEETTVKKKVKDTDKKENNGWIINIGIGLGFLLIIYLAYRIIVKRFF